MMKTKNDDDTRRTNDNNKACKEEKPSWQQIMMKIHNIHNYKENYNNDKHDYKTRKTWFLKPPVLMLRRDFSLSIYEVATHWHMPVFPLYSEGLVFSKLEGNTTYKVDIFNRQRRNKFLEGNANSIMQRMNISTLHFENWKSWWNTIQRVKAQ
jgi:hypothetical protein